VDPWIDPRTEAVRAIHLAPLVEWIDSRWLGDGDIRILDLGCGDMLLARLLGSGHVVDGYDPAEPARAAARSGGRRAAMTGSVFDDSAEIPLGAYDAVVISSVLQYVPGDRALTEMLSEVAGWLRPDRSLGAIATDVPLPGGSRLSDASDMTRALVPHLGLRGAMRTLLAAARRSPGDLHSFGESDVAACAGRAGLEAERLARNLSPFRSRASYHFRRC
jgi:SAM-dependent methyltransferase